LVLILQTFLIIVSNSFNCQDALFNQPEPHCQNPLNQSTEKKYQTWQKYQTRKNYPGKKKFHCQPAKHFHFKKPYQKEQKV